MLASLFLGVMSSAAMTGLAAYGILRAPSGWLEESRRAEQVAAAALLQTAGGLLWWGLLPTAAAAALSTGAALALFGLYQWRHGALRSGLAPTAGAEAPTSARPAVASPLDALNALNALEWGSGRPRF